MHIYIDFIMMYTGKNVVDLVMVDVKEMAIILAQKQNA